MFAKLGIEDDGHTLEWNLDTCISFYRQSQKQAANGFSQALVALGRREHKEGLTLSFTCDLLSSDDREKLFLMIKRAIKNNSHVKKCNYDGKNDWSVISKTVKTQRELYPDDIQETFYIAFMLNKYFSDFLEDWLLLKTYNVQSGQVFRIFAALIPDDSRQLSLGVGTFWLCMAIRYADTYLFKTLLSCLTAQPNDFQENLHRITSKLVEQADTAKSRQLITLLQCVRISGCVGIISEFFHALFAIVTSSDNKKLFAELLLVGFPLDTCLDQLADESECRKLLTYRASRHPEKYTDDMIGTRTISEWGQLDAEDKKITPEDFEALVYDGLDTDGEESSDDECEADNFKEMYDLQAQARADDSHQTLARGVHYMASSWFGDTAHRRATYESTYHVDDVISHATRQLAAPGEQYAGDYDASDDFVKQYLSELVQKEPTEAGRGQATFGNLYHQLIHRYTNKNGPNALFNEGELQSTYGFSILANPLVSTSHGVGVAMKYASGGRFIGAGDVFLPNVRRSTGEFKYRHLGYVQVYVVPNTYLQAHSSDIADLHGAKYISVNPIYAHNQEVVIHSKIPAEYIWGYQLFALPKMNVAWSEDIETQFGLAESRYNKFRTRLRDQARAREPGATMTNELEETIKSLIKAVTVHQIGLLQASVSQRLGG